MSKRVVAKWTPLDPQSIARYADAFMGDYVNSLGDYLTRFIRERLEQTTKAPDFESLSIDVRYTGTVKNNSWRLNLRVYLSGSPEWMLAERGWSGRIFQFNGRGKRVKGLKPSAAIRRVYTVKRVPYAIVIEIAKPVVRVGDFALERNRNEWTGKTRTIKRGDYVEGFTGAKWLDLLKDEIESELGRLNLKDYSAKVRRYRF